MKKRLVFLVSMNFLFLSLSAQNINRFKGIVTQKVFLQDTVMKEVYSVYDHKMSIEYEETKDRYMVIEDSIIWGLIDMDMDFKVLKKLKVEVEGSGKFFFKIPYAKEKNDVNVEYISLKKTIQGYEAKKAIIIRENGLGKRSLIEVWYTEEIGPEYNTLIIPFVKGFPLEVTETNEKGEITMKRITLYIENGFVKKNDFLIPIEYEESSLEKYNGIINIINTNPQLKARYEYEITELSTEDDYYYGWTSLFFKTKAAKLFYYFAR